ncbi:MAG: NAD-dependent epimerase/dehydratase family protein [Tenericutes bacterium]|nr:NAD-dependent epimerase/dehydratase family protein [Mycoplasmatota bacterium]
MKCFVTGATGHLGNVLVKELYNKGHQVTSLILKGDSLKSVIEPYTRFVEGNILDYDLLKEAVKDYDVVYHLAGMVEIGSGKKKKLYKINVEGTKNILKVCQENKIKRLVYTSSVHAFEESPKGEVMHEPKEFDYKKVKGNYAITKAIASDLILNQTDKDLEVVLVCPSGVIGPFDYQLSNTGQLFVDFLLKRLTAYIKGSYNFVDVRDLVEGIISASIKGRNKEVYLLTGSNITVKELLDMISELTGMKKIKTRLARWFILSMSYFAELYYRMRNQKPLFTYYSIKVLASNHLFSSEKAQKEFGYKTRDIRDTIKDTLDFAKEHYLVKRGKKWKKKLNY